jgi:hypothetical protein
MNPAKLICALALALPAFAAHAAPVAVFTNPAVVDAVGGQWAEASNIQLSLAAAGHTVSTFDAMDAAGISAALAGKSVMILPEQEQGALYWSLDAAALNVIKAFVQAGGGLVVNYDYYESLNEIFGFSMVSQSTSGSSSLMAAAAGTKFAGGPATLPWNDDTGGLVSASLPAGSQVIYETNGIATVSLTQFGAGQILHLGWDWFDAKPAGSLDGGWLDVLGRGIDQLDTAAPAAVPEPSSIALLGLGLAGLARTRRKKRA